MVDFILTNDSSFRTEENFTIGTPFSEVKSILGSAVIKEVGYAFKVRLASGWYACFTQGQTMTDGNLKNTSEIKLFQKI